MPDFKAGSRLRPFPRFWLPAERGVPDAFHFFCFIQMVK